MIRTVLAGSLVCCLGFAADASAQTWQGGYIGGSGGLTIGKADATTTVPSAGDYFAPSSVTSINENGLFELKPKGYIFGGQLGFNGQSGAAVFGIEADFGLMDLSETDDVTVEYPCCAGTDYTISQTVETSWMFTVRPRVGVAAGNVLIYGTGGLAMTNLTYSAAFDDTFAEAHADALVTGGQGPPGEVHAFPLVTRGRAAGALMIALGPSLRIWAPMRASSEMWMNLSG